MEYNKQKNGLRTVHRQMTHEWTKKLAGEMNEK